MADVELTQALLGLNPYVLLTFVDGGEGRDEVCIEVKAGGGIVTPAEIKGALELALGTLAEEMAKEGSNSD